MNFFEDLIKYFESIIVLFTIPYAYLETRESKFDKLLDIIDQLSDIVLNRISSNVLISKHEIESMINSSLLKSKLSPKSILLDNILDKVVSKIESNSFIKKIERRQLIEKIILLRQNKRANVIKYYRFLKTNKTNIISFLIILFLILTLIFPNKWQLFQTLDQHKKIIYQCGIGLMLASITFIMIRLLIGLFSSKVFEGEPPFETDSFNYFPYYYNEYLSFKCGDKIQKLKLELVNYDLEKKIVETDSGFLSLGIIKFYKNLRNYKLVFVNDNFITITISLSKISIRNGTIDLDKITYAIDTKPNETTQYFYPQKSTIADINLQDEFVHFTNNYGLEHGYKSTKSIENIVVLDNNKKFWGVYIEGAFWKLEGN
jgi:hypothetical protein